MILIGGGSFIQSQAGSTNIVNLSSTIAVAAIVIGIIITLISFFGCFGAANEKGGLLKTYFALLIILVILEFSIGIAAVVKKNEVLLQLIWVIRGYTIRDVRR